MISYERAREVFEKYLDGYDRDEDKIRLKIVHTYGVVNCMNAITGRMGLSEEDRQLAAVIALLHDIGRFEQLRRFNSFEPTTMDHAAYGVQVLFEEGMIRRFVEEPKWDTVIRNAIAWHSAFAIEGIMDERMLLHARLIRDADKLDNCRVKLEEALQTMLGTSEEEVGSTSLSDSVYHTVMNRSCILLGDRKTKADYWASYIAYFFDIYFPETMQMILEQNFIHRIIHRIQYSNPVTAQRMEQMEACVIQYAQEFVNNRNK